MDLHVDCIILKIHSYIHCKTLVFFFQHFKKSFSLHLTATNNRQNLFKHTCITLIVFVRVEIKVTHILYFFQITFILRTKYMYMYISFHRHFMKIQEHYTFEIVHENARILLIDI